MSRKLRVADEVIVQAAATLAAGMTSRTNEKGEGPFPPKMSFEKALQIVVDVLDAGLPSPSDKKE